MELSSCGSGASRSAVRGNILLHAPNGLRRTASSWERCGARCRKSHDFLCTERLRKAEQRRCKLTHEFVVQFSMKQRLLVFRRPSHDLVVGRKPLLGPRVGLTWGDPSGSIWIRIRDKLLTNRPRGEPGRTTDILHRRGSGTVADEQIAERPRVTAAASGLRARFRFRPRWESRRDY